MYPCFIISLAKQFKTINIKSNMFQKFGMIKSDNSSVLGIHLAVLEL